VAGPAALPGDYDPALVQLAARVQASFQERGKSLTDPDTAEAFRVALDFIAEVHAGALATGVLDEPQHATLSGMVESAWWVPDVVGGTAEIV
jgi:hypothetical protein